MGDALSSRALAICCFTTLPRAFFLLVRPAFGLQEMDALRQKVSVWFGDETAFSLETAPQLRARLKRLAPEEVPFLQVRRRVHELLLVALGSSEGSRVSRL